MAGKVRIGGFTGMNNIRKSHQLDMGNPNQVEAHMREPRIVLNADASSRGQLIKREGYQQLLSLVNAHSLWSGLGALLYVEDGVLCRYVSGEVVQVASIDGPNNSPLHYEVCQDVVFVSNPYWKGIFNPADNSISDWGVPLPPQPTLGLPGGSEYGLPAGTYFICYTQGTEENPSGPGQMIESSGGIITLTNRPEGAVVWCTDTASGVFYRVGQVDTITKIETSEPLEWLFCGPPLCMTAICFAFGRMWGAHQNRIYYSEPYYPGLYNLKTSYFEFETSPQLIARVRTGLFVGCETETFFLAGRDPKRMEQYYAGAGAVPGTLQYCNDVGELGDTISPPEKTHTDVPIWVSRDSGIVAGNNSGRLYSLSSSKIRFASGRRGASLFRKVNGEIQFLTTSKAGYGSGFGMTDDVEIEVYRQGRLIQEGA